MVNDVNVVNDVIYLKIGKCRKCRHSLVINVNPQFNRRMMFNIFMGRIVSNFKK